MEEEACYKIRVDLDTVVVSRLSKNKIWTVHFKIFFEDRMS